MAVQPIAPVPRQGDEMFVIGAGDRVRGFTTRDDPLLEVRLQLSRESRRHELVRQNRRKADGHGSGRTFRRELAQRLEQRQVGIDRRFAQPVAAVRPTPMVQDIREVTVQPEDEIH